MEFDSEGDLESENGGPDNGSPTDDHNGDFGYDEHDHD